MLYDAVAAASVDLPYYRDEYGLKSASIKSYFMKCEIKFRFFLYMYKVTILLFRNKHYVDMPKYGSNKHHKPIKQISMCVGKV